MKWFWNKIIALKNIVLWTFTKRLFRVWRKFYAHFAHPKCYKSRCEMARSISLKAPLSEYLKNLNLHGFARVGHLLEGPLMQELDTTVANREKTWEPTGEFTGIKDFWNNAWKPEDWALNSVFVKIALHQNVLSVVANYLGQIPYLAWIELAISEGKSHDKWKASQLWHRDLNDTKICKLFIYLTDVDSEAGPFTLIPANRVQRLKGERFFPIHKQDKEMDRMGGLHYATPILGKKLSTFFVDTYRCYHMGSRLREGKKRIMYIATYTSFAPFTPFYNRVQVNRSLTTVENLVLTRFGQVSESSHENISPYH